MTFLKDLKFEIKDIILILGILGLFYKYDQKQSERYYDLRERIEKLASDYNYSKENKFKLGSYIIPNNIKYITFRIINEAILPSSPKVPERIKQLA